MTTPRELVAKAGELVREADRLAAESGNPFAGAMLIQLLAEQDLARLSAVRAAHERLSPGSDEHLAGVV